MVWGESEELFEWGKTAVKACGRKKREKLVIRLCVSQGEREIGGEKEQISRIFFFKGKIDIDKGSNLINTKKNSKYIKSK